MFTIRTYNSTPIYINPHTILRATPGDDGEYQTYVLIPAEDGHGTDWTLIDMPWGCFTHWMEKRNQCLK